MLVMPEREKEPDWKIEDHNISGTRNRNRCYNTSKSEALKPGLSAESPLKQNGGYSPDQVSAAFLIQAQLNY